MLIDTKADLLIQRCVDDELSPPEMRALLQRLDGLDGGWKKLACELLEDRGLRRVLRNDAVSTPGPVREAGPGSSIAGRVTPIGAGTVRPALQLPAAPGWRGWWSHPLTSLSLCAAIAFVGGMLIPERDQQTPLSGVTPSSLRSEPIGGGMPQAMNVDQSPAGSYRFQLQPGGQSVDVPVYGRLDDLVRLDRNNPLFSDVFRNAKSGNGQVQWMLVPTDDGRSMLIPVSEDTVGGMQ